MRINVRFSATCNSRFLFPLLLTGMLGTGFGGPLPGGRAALAQEAQEPTKPPTTDPAQPPTPIDKSSSLKLSATTDKKTYAVGSPIKMTLTVKNAANVLARLRFSNGQRYDFVLREGTRPDGKIVWQWSRGKMFTMMLASEKLEPGKSLTYTTTYDPKTETHDAAATPLKAGSYTLTAIVTIMGSAPPRPSTTAQLTVK